MNILIINGPNLNLIGKRNPKVYGTQSMEQTLVDIQRRWSEAHFVYKQSNHEGNIIDWLQNGTAFDGVILNAGGYSHTSIAIRDAVEYLREQSIPVIEVHISDIYSREDFRKHSLLADVCSHSIVGQGIKGYELAIEKVMTKK